MQAWSRRAGTGIPIAVGLTCLVLSLGACASHGPVSRGDPQLSFPGERRIQNLRQLTRGGTNAEAYWSFDGSWLVFQHKGPGLSDSAGPEAKCDQIYRIRPDGTDVQRVSTGRGRTTCGYFFPGDSRILYSSTHSASPDCPPEPDFSRGYVWPIYDTYQIYSAKPDGSDLIPLEPGAPRAYNAEATVCHDGSVVFTSDRDGDLDLYVGKLNRLGTLDGVRRVTNLPGYDGGAFFSQDCERIVWRASRPRPGPELDEYQALLARHLVKPGRLEIWVANADGSEARQVSRLGAASFAPFFTPDGRSIVFASNPDDPKGRRFDLHLIRDNGTGLERLTHSGSFDSFPMFSPDGRHIAFSSNRFGSRPRETNLFIGDWADTASLPPTLDSPRAEDRFQARVAALSDPSMEGRRVGGNGLARAEELVARWFEETGLQPLEATFLQKVEIQTGIAVDSAKTSLARRGEKTLGLRSDFIPSFFSTSGSFKGPVIDAGFGVVAPELGLDDYASRDARGKVALVRRHLPRNTAATPAQERAHADLRYKAFLAREKGAVAVLFWESDPDLPQELSDPEKAAGSALASAGRAGIPVGHVSREIAERWLSARPEVEGEFALETRATTAHNVVGRLGEACAAGARPVVVGAHLDHLGAGGEGSLEPTGSGIHPGADDNASGVSALIEIARLLREGAKPAELKTACWIFAAFTAEEVGVAGSSALVESLKARKMRPKAMLNLDMVGRLRGNHLLVFGSESAREWPKWVGDACAPPGLRCDGGGDGVGPSDQMPFYLAGAPVLHFFTGAHADYHRTGDVADKVNATGGIQVAEVVAALARIGGHAKTRLTYQKPSGTSFMGPLGRRGDTRSHSAYLGTIPDYSALSSPSGPGGDRSARGVPLAGVRPGSPAERAGVRAGDVLISVAEAQGAQPRSVQSLEDFMFVLQALRPDQDVVLEVRRGDERLHLNARVGRRE